MKNKKLQIVKNQIARMLNEQPTKKKAGVDVTRIMGYINTYIGEKIEYAQLLQAVLEYDVPGKQAAINIAFKNNPSLKAIVRKSFGDETDSSTTTNWGQESEPESMDTLDPKDSDDEII